MTAQPICITGMHRSGTSFAARWLAESGLVLDRGGLVPASEWNPEGHFEDLDFVRLHEDRIRASYPRSLGWKLGSSRPLEFGPRVTDAERLLTDRRTSAPNWGWKDPRSVPFLEAWKSLAPDLRVLLLWRPVEEVQASLVRRSRARRSPTLRISSRAAVRNWVHYNEALLDYIDNHRHDTLLVELAALRHLGESSLHRIGDFVGVDLSPPPTRSARPERNESSMGAVSRLGWTSLQTRIRAVRSRLLANTDIASS